MDLHQFNADSKFLPCHFCSARPNKCRLSGHLCITIFAFCNIQATYRMSALYCLRFGPCYHYFGLPFGESNTFPLGLLHIPPAFPKAFGTWSCTQSCKQSSVTLAHPLLLSHGTGKRPLRSAPPSCTNLPSFRPLEHSLCPIPPGSASQSKFVEES